MNNESKKKESILRNNDISGFRENIGGIVYDRCKKRKRTQ